MSSGQPIDRYLDEKPRLRINVPTPLTVSSSKFAIATQYSSPQSASSVATRRSSSSSDVGSQISSAPTSATSVTSRNDAMEPSYWLQCTFYELDCKVQFHPGDSAAWYSHCSSHWNGHPAPRDCLCIFCDKVFRGSRAWDQRMSHIARHLAGGLRVEESRPDFALYRHMYENNLLSERDHINIKAYSECENRDLGLVTSNYPMEKGAASRNDVVCWDQRREDRERKAAHRPQKGKGRESKHHHRN